MGWVSDGWKQSMDKDPRFYRKYVSIIIVNVPPHKNVDHKPNITYYIPLILFLEIQNFLGI